MTELSQELLATFSVFYRQIIRGHLTHFPELSTMLGYQMGWNDPDGKPQNAPGGKQIRPLLALLSCGAREAPAENALSLAAAIELIHTFSLIHDDVMDVSETRRGRPSVWTVWGVNQAINAGDGAYGLGFQILANAQTVSVAAELLLHAEGLLGKACVDTVQGQMMDIRFETRQDVSVDEYVTMTSLKTGPLLGLALGGGALLAGADDDTVTALDEIGRTLGVAFQMQDDILGVWGDPDQTGKSASDDLVQKKKSMPVLWALENLEDASREQLVARYRQPAPLSAEDAVFIRDLLTEAGVRKVVAQAAQTYYNQVVEGLHAHYPDNPFRAEMLRLVDFVLDREY